MMRFAVLFHLPDCKIDSVPFDMPLLRFSRSIPPARNRRFPMHSRREGWGRGDHVGRSVSRVVPSPFSRTRITIGVTSGKPRGKTVKVAVHRERAFPPSPRNLISLNVIHETRLDGGATICIRALESFDSDFQLARLEGEEEDAGMSRGRETGVDALSVSPRKEREREETRERLVEVSSPWIVPAIIYFLSDRGDRLYGGCSVQAPGSSAAIYRVARTYCRAPTFILVLLTLEKYR